MIDLFLNTVSFIWSFTLGKAMLGVIGLYFGIKVIQGVLWLIYRHRDLVNTPAIERETIGYGLSRDDAEAKAKRIMKKSGVNEWDESRTKTTTTYIYSDDKSSTSVSVRQREPKMPGSPKKNEYKIKK